MTDCVFCKIAAGEIPNYTVYEDKDFLAFLDIVPRTKGHTLIIPKEHYRWVWDVPNIGKYYEVAQKVAKALQKAMDTEWIVSLVVGEEVPHAHIWLVPRHEGDGHGGFVDIQKVQEFSQEEMTSIAEKIRKQM